jgi:NADH/NAD ratio-sensing transcriptional regulator Rex
MEKPGRKLEEDLVTKGAKGILNFSPVLDRTC